MKKLVIGCGYLGGRVARLWRDQGDTVFATTRSDERRKLFSDQGFLPIKVDITRPPDDFQLPAVETVLVAVGFDRASGVSKHRLYVEGLENVLSVLPPETGRIIYISSTGVYGQTDDSWVDELSECSPARQGGKACLAAEQLLGRHPMGSRSIVLRLAGIYGPGRVPRRELLAQRQPIPSKPNGYLNLVHVDDAAQVVLAAERRASPPQTFTVADGNPVRRGDFYRELARRMGVDVPTFCDPPEGEALTCRSAGSKRVSNRKLTRELGVVFRRPDYLAGLDDIFGANASEVR